MRSFPVTFNSVDCFNSAFTRRITLYELLSELCFKEREIFNPFTPKGSPLDDGVKSSNVRQSKIY